VSSGGVPWASQQDTPQRADVHGSKEVNFKVIAYLLGEEVDFVQKHLGWRAALSARPAF
jgi:hypothetical protein